MANIDSKGKEIVSIVAKDLNDIIGDSRHNKMPWQLPPYDEDEFFKFRGPFSGKDMGRYKDVTRASYVICGVNTAASMIPMFPLPFMNKDQDFAPRRSVVVSRTKSKEDLLNMYDFNTARDFEVFTSMEDAIANVPEDADKIVLSGGTNVYELGHKYADKIYITQIHQQFEGDVKYPEIPSGKFTILSEDPFIGTEFAGRVSFETHYRSSN